MAFRRFRAADVRSILAAGAGTPQPRPAGDALILDLPVAPTRSLDAYTVTPAADGGVTLMTTTPAKATKPVAPLSVPALAADLDAGLRRLKLAAIRRTAPEVLHHRQDPTLDPRGSAADPGRDRTRRTGCLQRRQPAQGRRRSPSPRPSSPSTWPPPRSSQGVRLPVQPGMGSRTTEPGDHRTRRAPASRHTLIGLGIAAIHAGHKVRYFTAADLVETLYRGLADNTVGKIIESLLRVDLIILDELGLRPARRHRHPTAVPARRRRLRTPIPGHRLALAVREWGRFLPEQTTAVSILDRLLHHATVVITDGESYRMKDAQHRKENPQPT